jgi:cephalosporin hydroxylase
LFIDGCHKYEAVMQDINLWQPLLLPGGYLLLHDYAISSEAGVIEAAQDTIIRSGHYHRFLLVDRLLVAQRIVDQKAEK